MGGSGVRIGELLSLNIGHVQFDRYGAVVIVNGKTGMRRLRLISSVPDIQTWINMHPLRADANAPLFVTSRRYGHEPRRMSIQTIENKLKYVARKLGMTKPIYPHAIRHARLTDLTRSNGKKQRLSEMELRLVVGWEKNSAMPEVYIHLFSADVERKLLENAGLIDDTPDPADTVLKTPAVPAVQGLERPRRSLLFGMLDGARRGGGKGGGRVDGGGEAECGLSAVTPADQEGFGIIVTGIASLFPVL